MLEKPNNKRRVFVLVTAINVLFLAIVFVTVKTANASESSGNFTLSNDGTEIILYSGNTFDWSRIAFITKDSFTGEWFTVSNWYKTYYVDPGQPLNLPTSITDSLFLNESQKEYYLTEYKTPCTDFLTNGPTGCFSYSLTPIYYISGAGNTSVWKFSEPPPTYTEPTYTTAYNTKFESVNALAGELLVTHFVDNEEYNPAISEFNPDLIRVQTSLVPTTNIVGASFAMTDIVGTHTTGADVSTLPDGLHDVFISFANTGCILGLSACPFPDSYINLRIEMASGTVAIVGTPEFYDSTTFADETATQPCGITNIQGCIVNALRFLFVPSEPAITQFSDTWQQVRTKPPFGYVTSIIDETQTLTATSTPAWEMPDLPFVTAIFEPIKTALALILWGIFGVYFYIRVTKIEL